VYRLGMARGRSSSIRTLRLSGIGKHLALTLAAASSALVLLLVHVFVPLQGLQVVALLFTGMAFATVWLAVLSWRMPVFSMGTLWAFTTIWCIGLGLAVLLVLAAWTSDNAIGWRIASSWLAFSISLAVGGLQFRALFNRRATPVLGRSLSLLSPMIILTLILVLSLRAS
jgi:hypothetical protein